VKNKYLIEFIKNLPENAEVVAEATSNSMSPLIKNGDKIFIKKVNFSKVQAEDVIALYIADKNNIIVHRVTKIKKNRKRKYCITKGDNNPSEDPWITTKNNFLGKVRKAKKPLLKNLLLNIS